MADVTSPFGFPYPEDTDLVRDGATDIENLATGVNDYLTGGFLYAGTRYYTSSGQFEKADPLGTGDIGLRAIRVRMVGGGGGSGGTEATGAGENALGGSGAGGGYAERFVTDISGLNASVTVTRGSGGTAGAVNGAGGTGGTSSFGLIADSYYTAATGGGEGARGAALTLPRSRTNGPGGIGTHGDLLLRGGPAEVMGMGGVTNFMVGPAGGNSHFGGGARGQESNGDAGRAGDNYGGGASGAVGRASEIGYVGAVGGNGIVIVDCFV